MIENSTCTSEISPPKCVFFAFVSATNPSTHFQSPPVQKSRSLRVGWSLSQLPEGEGGVTPTGQVAGSFQGHTSVQHWGVIQRQRWAGNLFCIVRGSRNIWRLTQPRPKLSLLYLSLTRLSENLHRQYKIANTRRSSWVKMKALKWLENVFLD